MVYADHVRQVSMKWPVDLINFQMRIRALLKNTKAFTLKVGQKKLFLRSSEIITLHLMKVSFFLLLTFINCKEERTLKATRSCRKVEKEAKKMSQHPPALQTYKDLVAGFQGIYWGRPPSHLWPPQVLEVLESGTLSPLHEWWRTQQLQRLQGLLK